MSFVVFTGLVSLAVSVETVNETNDFIGSGHICIFSDSGDKISEFRKDGVILSPFVHEYVDAELSQF